MSKNWRRRRITVVFVERVPWGGGAERVVIDLARNLNRRLFNPIVVYLYNGKEAPQKLTKNIKFIKLVPYSSIEFIKAAYSGFLGTELRSELNIVTGRIKFRVGFIIQYLKSKICYIEQRVINARQRAILRLRNIYVAWQTNQVTNYLNERISKIQGIPFQGRPFVIPAEVPPSRVFARINRAKIRLQASLKKVLPVMKKKNELNNVSGLSELHHKFLKTEQFNKKNSSLASVPYFSRRPIDMARQARLFEAFCNTLRGPVVVVAIMEEAAAMVRLTLGEKPNSRWPYILSTHAWESYYFPIMYGSPGFDVDEEHFLFAAACRGAEAILSPCIGCRDDLITHFSSPQDRTLCYPNPVDLKQIRADSIAQFSVPLPVACEGKPLLLHVGRLDPQKRHKLLFEACAWLVEHEQNFHLLCIGDGQLRGELEKFVDNLGLNKFVSFLGFIKNPFPFMRRARALVLPSESESFALVLVEALACGCVPVAFDCPHGPRDVLDGGRAGFLVREETPQALAQAIYQALNDDFLVTEKLRYGESWIEQYSLTQMVPKWENLLARVAISRNLSN